MAALTVVSVTALSGCAAKSSHTLSSRFVKPGEPTVKLEGPTSAPFESLADYSGRIRTLQAHATTKKSMLPTIESNDPALAKALLVLAMSESAENHRRVAEAYRAARVDDYAFRHLQRAVVLEPCNSEAHEGLARLWRDWGMAGAALGDAHRAVYCRPQSPSAYNTLGTVLAALDQKENARSAFEFAVRLDNRAGYALNNLCYLSLQAGDPAAAQRTCERALAVDPTLVAASTNLALAYAMQGDVPRAEARLTDRRDAARGQYNVGILRMSLGRYQDAADAFQLAAKNKPSLADAARRAVQARRAAADAESNQEQDQ
jgi:Flp pilus assembly protein TadD